LAAVSLSLAAIVTLLLPASSFAAVSCSYSRTDRLLKVTAADAFAGVTRAGDAITVDNGFADVSCAGGSPTVFNTDLLQITNAGQRSDRIDLSGGPFGPGATPELGGTSEIEFDYVDPTSIDIHGSPVADRLTLGPASGINLNGDGDVDVSGRFTSIVLEGRAGDDLIGPQSDYSGIGAHTILAGGGGSDTLIASREGGVVHGGARRDEIIGDAGRDNITGGQGSDLIRARGGRDVIRAIDGTKDRIVCGGGFDSVKVDTVDKLKGCERLIVVKGPRR
jgi:hypothetical protein